MKLTNILRLVNVFPIVRYHYSDLKNDSPRPFVDLSILLAIPFFVSLLGILIPVGDEFIKNLVPVISILFGFTFNSLIIMAQHSDSEGGENKAIKHTRANTLYAVLVGLITLVVFGIASLVYPYITAISTFKIPMSGVSIPLLNLVSIILFFFLFHYITTLFMILRRMYILIEGGAFENTK